MTHNSSTDENVTRYIFGPGGINSNAVAESVGFVFAYGTTLGARYCPGQTYTSTYSCYTDQGYCHASPSWSEMYRDNADGHMYYRVGPGVRGIRIKLQAMYIRSSGSAVRIYLNGAVVFSGTCSSCPSIVTLSVQEGDELVFEDKGVSSMGLFWMELWQHTAWPPQTLPLSSSIGSGSGVYVPGESCDVCPTGFQGGNTSCLPTPTTGLASFAPTAPPPPISVKEVRQLSIAHAWFCRLYMYTCIQSTRVVVIRIMSSTNAYSWSNYCLTSMSIIVSPSLSGCPSTKLYRLPHQCLKVHFQFIVGSSRHYVQVWTRWHQQ